MVEFRAQERDLIVGIPMKDLAAKGLAGSVYTQTTDVENEVNGLLTYDRKVLKYDADALKKAHEAIIAAAEGK